LQRIQHSLPRASKDEIGFLLTRESFKNPRKQILKKTSFSFEKYKSSHGPKPWLFSFQEMVRKKKPKRFLPDFFASDAFPITFA
jgi:hypothetical protein